MGIEEELDQAFKDGIREASPANKILLLKIQALEDQIDAAVRDQDLLLITTLISEQNMLLRMMTDLKWSEDQNNK